MLTKPLGQPVVELYGAAGKEAGCRETARLSITWYAETLCDMLCSCQHQLGDNQLKVAWYSKHGCSGHARQSRASACEAARAGWHGLFAQMPLLHCRSARHTRPRASHPPPALSSLGGHRMHLVSKAKHYPGQPGLACLPVSKMLLNLTVSASFLSWASTPANTQVAARRAPRRGPVVIMLESGHAAAACPRLSWRQRAGPDG